MTLLYDPAERSADDVRVVLEEAGLVRAAGATLRKRLQPAPVSHVSIALIDAVNDLDSRLSRRMSSRIDLKGAAPLALLALASWKTASQGIGWKQIPAYQLFWYAWSVFRELNATVSRGDEEPD